MFKEIFTKSNQDEFDKIFEGGKMPSITNAIAKKIWKMKDVVKKRDFILSYIGDTITSAAQQTIRDQIPKMSSDQIDMLISNMLLKAKKLGVVKEDITESKCQHKIVVPEYDHSRCTKCGAVHTDGNRSWGVAKDLCFDSLTTANFFKDNGRLPDLKFSWKKECTTLQTLED